MKEIKNWLILLAEGVITLVGIIIWGVLFGGLWCIVPTNIIEFVLLSVAGIILIVLPLVVPDICLGEGSYIKMFIKETNDSEEEL